MLERTLALARRAIRRPPRYVARRIGQEIVRQLQRPWYRVRPHLVTARAIGRRAGSPSIDALWDRLAAQPFFLGPAERDAWRRAFLDAYPEATSTVVREADAVLRHEFDLLGSGPVALGARLPWHVDFKTGRRWPLRHCHAYELNELDQPSDVKVPWELSRCQHFARLGQARWLTGDERYAREFVDQVTDWLDANPYGRGINWACPMDVALRAVSWVWAFYFFADARACAGLHVRSRLLRALYLHGEFLAANPEIDEVNGNHRFVDGVGLVVLGLLFRATRPGRRWLDAGRRVVFDELTSQVHGDGVDFEGSIAYHRLVLEAALTALLLLRLHDERLPTACWERLERMFDFVLAYTKPDGRAPLIGDADDGRVQKLGVQAVSDHRYLLSTGAVLFERGDLKRGAGRFWEESFWLLGPGGLAAYEKLAVASADPESRAFPVSGFHVLRHHAAHVVVDCGDVGLRGLGGHGHNDVLSFELVLAGLPLVTDCGAYLYTASREWRNRFRSTAFHNTVEIDGEELNRLIHPDLLWRLRNDAVPTTVTWRPTGDWGYLRAGHRGYARLPSPVIHEREFLLHHRRPLLVLRDRLSGSGRHRLVWRFHLEPGVRAEGEPEAIRLATPAGPAWLMLLAGPPGLVTHCEPGWVSPRYGVRTPTSVVVSETASAVPVDLVWAFTAEPPSPDTRAQCLAALEACA